MIYENLLCLQPVPCPKGSYCPTGVSVPIRCGPGEYGATTGLVDSTDCTICPSGTYCDGYGLSGTSIYIQLY